MIGVLALQGNYSKHIEILDKLKISSCEVRYNNQLDEINGLIIFTFLAGVLLSFRQTFRLSKERNWLQFV